MRKKELYSWEKENNKRNKERRIAAHLEKGDKVIKLPKWAPRPCKEEILMYELENVNNQKVFVFDHWHGDDYIFELKYPCLQEYRNEWKYLDDSDIHSAMELIGISAQQLETLKWGREEPGTR